MNLNDFNTILDSVSYKGEFDAKCIIINSIVESENRPAFKELLIFGRNLLVEVMLGECSRYLLSCVEKKDDPEVVTEWIDRSNKLPMVKRRFNRFWNRMISNYYAEYFK